LPEEEFLSDSGWSNINRSPYDRVSGVLYKRAMAIKSVQYTPLDPAPDMPEPWQGRGETLVRWLFSEEPGTEEGLLEKREFRALQVLVLAPGASSGQRSHPGRDTILCVVEGEGALSHRPSSGAPVLQRPLRKGDAVFIDGNELYSITNGDAEKELRLVVLHLAASDASQARQIDA
jgi:quercetin dioxygenase-like cupin family protein